MKSLKNLGFQLLKCYYKVYVYFAFFTSFLNYYDFWLQMLASHQSKVVYISCQLALWEYFWPCGPSIPSLPL